MPTAGLAKKLLLKPGASVLVINPPDGYLERLDAPEGVEIATAGEGPFDVVQLFIKDGAELGALGDVAFSAARPDGVFWLCYPKGTAKLKTDVNRDTLVARIREERDWEGVAMVSIDDTWSALRLRPAGAVKRR